MVNMIYDNIKISKSVDSPKSIIMPLNSEPVNAKGFRCSNCGGFKTAARSKCQNPCSAGNQEKEEDTHKNRKERRQARSEANPKGAKEEFGADDPEFRPQA